MLRSMQVAISSPDRMFLDGLVCLFSGSRFNVVVTASDTRDCITAGRNNEVSLFVIDLWGAADRDIHFLLGAQTFGDLRAIFVKDPAQNLPAGMDVVVNRSDSGQSLIDMALATVADLAGSGPRGRGRPRMSTHGFALAPREYEVASLISKGFTNQKIAEAMSLKEQSVKNLVSTVIRKLRCENRVQVALLLSRSVAGS